METDREVGRINIEKKIERKKRKKKINPTLLYSIALEDKN